MDKSAMMKMLDLYCGEGLAAWGYWLSGCFSEIVGVDNDPQMSTRYSFDFLCADALSLTYDFLLSFDFIHASPPCQGYSKRTPDKSKHPRLIAATHLMLHATALPYVIENVEGSGQELKPNLVFDGEMFGLPSVRRRYFHLSSMNAVIDAHFRQMRSAAATQMRSSQRINIHGDTFVSRNDIIKALGLEVINERRVRDLTRTGMEQGIPPVFTRSIATALFPKVLVG